MIHFTRVPFFFLEILVYILGPNGNEFRLFNGKRNFTEANKSCVIDEGGKLAILNSEQLVGFAREKFSNRSFWIGATEYGKGIWKWINGSEIAWQHWAPNEPDGGSRETCLIFSQGWRDINCGHFNSYLCEREREHISNRVCSILP